MALEEAPGSVAPGCEVTVRLSGGEEISGEVLGVDAERGVAAIRTKGAVIGRTTLRLVNTNLVRSVDAADPPETEPGPLPLVDAERTRGRLAKAVRRAEQDAAKVGLGVSRRAQQVFDVVSKTLPARWDGKKIVVLDEVVIVEPYTSASCSSLASADSTVLKRVRLVMEMEPQLASP